ncbi:aldehyde dehydrogenase family protein [Sphingomonas bisphenolicum]
MKFDTDFHMLINGTLHSGNSRLDVINPATEQVIGSFPDAAPDDLDQAAAAARAAFPGWAATPIAERQAALAAMAQAVIAHIDPLKRLLTAEHGKPLAEAEVELQGVAYWLKSAARFELPVTINEDSATRYSETRHVPLGVVGAIAPWNYPLLLAIFKVGPALIAGNCVVLKPSPFTPLTTLKFGELVKDLLPPGVFNIVTGGDSLGPWMTSHPAFDKISFTGSTATGRKIMETAAATLKRVTLELGGNDAAIVMPDVDVGKVAKDLFWAAFRNNGQMCIATKRMYVHKDVYEPLKNALLDYAQSVKLGDGSEPETQIGPMNNVPQYHRVLDLIEDAKAKGYTVISSGEPVGKSGYFIPITIVDNPPEDSRIVQEEQFGPVLPILKFDDIEDVIERVNASSYGLGASVWGGDEDAAFKVAKRIASGTVWVNETQHLSPSAAFGGMKQSGIGVEGGQEGLLEYTSAQTIVRRKAATLQR